VTAPHLHDPAPGGHIFGLLTSLTPATPAGAGRFMVIDRLSRLWRCPPRTSMPDVDAGRRCRTSISTRLEPYRSAERRMV